MNTKENFLKEAKEFKEREKDLYDVLALYEYTLTNITLSRNIENILVENALNALKNGRVSYKKDKDVFNILNTETNRFYEIINKYKSKLENDEDFKKFNISKNEVDLREVFSGIFYRRELLKFDLINSLTNKIHKIEMIKKFIYSDLDIDIRCNMLNSALESGNISIYNLENLFVNKEEPEKVKELINNFNEETLYNIFNKNISAAPAVITTLQKNNLLDFNLLTFIYDTYTVSTPVASYVNNNDFNLMCTFYESDSYKNANEELKNNNDNILINILSKNDLIKFISLSNFELNLNNIEYLADRLFKIYLEEKDDTLLDKIKNSIISSSSNSKEYRQNNLKYQKLESLFLKKLNDYKIELIEKRNSFSKTLKGIENKTNNELSNNKDLDANAQNKLKKILKVSDLIKN